MRTWQRATGRGLLGGAFSAAGPSSIAARKLAPRPSSLLLLAARGARSRSGDGYRQGGSGGKNSSDGPRSGKGRGKKPTLPALITVPELCTAEKLAAELRMPFEQLLDMAEALGESIVGPSQPLSSELLELLAIEAGAESIDVQPVDLGRRPPLSDEERSKLPLRPPVVTLMGHVDHGKTSLLDAFRGSSIAAGEAGGITQSISAFTVDADTPQALTFIDTPGHELFASMRQRGASATDLVVLVVAVDAGVQPTTVQAIEFARGTSAPVVVAINKMDRDDADKEYPKVVQQLLSHGLVPEDMGGEVPFIGVSARTGLHLDELRETLLLQGELLELHAEPDGPAEGVILEASTQKGLGIVANMLVQRGCLSLGDYVVAGTTWGKVKVLEPTEGKARLKRAPPSTPVRLVGLKELPRTGDLVYAVPSEAQARRVAEFQTSVARLEELAEHEKTRRAELDARKEQQRAKTELEAEEGRVPWFIRKSRERQAERLQRQANAIAAAQKRRSDDGSPKVTTEFGGPASVPLVLKADSSGSLEALRASLEHFPTERVVMQVVRAELGSVTEGDVEFAQALEATIIGFNVSTPGKVKQQAEQLKVGVHTDRVIYELNDRVKEVLEAAIEPVFEEKELGQTEVQQIFTLTLNRKDRKEGMKKNTIVAGCRVVSGEAIAGARVRVLRGPEGKEEMVHDGKVVSLKSFKNEVKSVKRGQECGVILANSPQMEPGDVISFYDIVARKPSLYEAVNLPLAGTVAADDEQQQQQQQGTGAGARGATSKPPDQERPLY